MQQRIRALMGVAADGKKPYIATQTEISNGSPHKIDACTICPRLPLSGVSMRALAF